MLNGEIPEDGACQTLTELIGQQRVQVTNKLCVRSWCYAGTTGCHWGGCKVWQMLILGAGLWVQNQVGTRVELR